MLERVNLGEIGPFLPNSKRWNDSPPTRAQRGERSLRWISN